MNYKDIFLQYIQHTLSAEYCVQKLDSIIKRDTSIAERCDAVRARYVKGFIRRFERYQTGHIAVYDLCLNLRDLLIVIGTTRVTPFIYDIVKLHGSKFDLECYEDYMVGSVLRIPSWIATPEFVQDVYALHLDADDEQPRLSIGDGFLTQYTKFSSYKSFEQKIAVHTAFTLPGDHTLLIALPTSGGKSLVTQMLTVHSTGLTLVIVPTVALAIDQYQAAKDNLIENDNIYYYRGGSSSEVQKEHAMLYQALRDKKAKLLFSSPEAILNNPILFELLETAIANKELSNIVVDEAHVVPDWGTFFRPDFQIFSVVLRKWRSMSQGNIRTILLSATLSDDVVTTLFQLFGEPGHNVELRCDTLRSEPRFCFCNAQDRLTQQTMTLDAIKTLPKPMVIYVLEPKTAVELQKELCKLGFKNIPVFSGKTQESQRKEILEGWKAQEYDIIIGTSAFGIGVDKADVRTIVHACAPENLSRFYQEVGRSGRDGFPSLSVFLPYHNHEDDRCDLHKASGLSSGRILREENIANRWLSMILDEHAFIDGISATVNTNTTPPTMTEEEAEYAGNRNMSWNINTLLFLHRIGFIRLVDALYDQDGGMYRMTLTLLRLDVLNDKACLIEALKDPRLQEYNLQMEGYRALNKLVRYPTRQCWGQSFKQLFPLSDVVCNGCPVHHDHEADSHYGYQLRNTPELAFAPAQPSRYLQQRMGYYENLIVIQQETHNLQQEDVESMLLSLPLYGIGTLVVPPTFQNTIAYPGLVLTYPEFYEVVQKTPYLLFAGIFCVFDFDVSNQRNLLNALHRLEKYGYRKVFYGQESMKVPYTGKTVGESIEGRRITPAQLEKEVCHV